MGTRKKADDYRHWTTEALEQRLKELDGIPRKWREAIAVQDELERRETVGGG